jgi:hypothetical protein
MCLYVQMMDSKFPELQDIISTPKAEVSDHLVVVEDELVVVMADLDSGEDVP